MGAKVIGHAETREEATTKVILLRAGSNDPYEAFWFQKKKKFYSIMRGKFTEHEMDHLRFFAPNHPIFKRFKERR